MGGASSMGRSDPRSARSNYGGRWPSSGRAHLLIPMSFLFPPVPASALASTLSEGRADAIARLRAARGRPLPSGRGPARGILDLLGGAAPPDAALRIFQARPGPGGSVRLAQDVDLVSADSSLDLPFGLSPLAWTLHRLVLVAWTGPSSAPVLLAVGGIRETVLSPRVLARFRLDHAEIRSTPSERIAEAGALLVRKGERICLRAPAAEGLLAGDPNPLWLLVRDHRSPTLPSGIRQADLFGQP